MSHNSRNPRHLAARNGHRTGPAITLPLESYPLRVGDDRGRTALPEGSHLRGIVQIGGGDDRARGLDELPMPEQGV